MARYTINIGDDFPLGGDAGPGRDGGGSDRHRRHRRFGLFARVLFFLAVAAIVISHPVHTLLLLGLLLFLRRSPWFAELRERARAAWRERAWERHDWRGEWRGWQRYASERGGCWNRGRGERRDDGGHRGFV